jgi:hypothetical protein
VVKLKVGPGFEVRGNSFFAFVEICLGEWESVVSNLKGIQTVLPLIVLGSSIYIGTLVYVRWLKKVLPERNCLTRLRWIVSVIDG